MEDKYKTEAFGDKQSKNILKDASSSRGKAGSRGSYRFSTLYEMGVEIFKNRNILLELTEDGPHVLHKIFIPDEPQRVKGVSYPSAFRPLREIYSIEDFNLLENALEHAPTEVKDFWQPLVFPKAGNSDLLSFSERKLKMQAVKQARDLYEVLDYKQSFDPDGALTGSTPALTPLRWVPDKKWFSKSLHKLRFEDVFTIFPEAECQLLKLLIGRIGVGRSGHLPPGFNQPVVHTARMAAVIVGQDPGLGKSTIFNHMIAAFAKVGIESHTFKSTDDRFGLKRAAMADVCYKDDSALKNLKNFLASENTKILVTNGKLETEEKFKNSEEIQPRCVLIVNSNDWDPSVCYDLDSGIIDRVKLLSTYREVELMRRIDLNLSPLSEASPDLRPFSHLPWLAQELGVSVEALFLWCLRICTDYFWGIITDKSDLKTNRLQVEVRHWTTRLRIRFKSDMSNSFMAALVLSTIIRSRGEWVPKEMNYNIMVDALHDFWFLGIDPSGNSIMRAMKVDWEKSGRISTHPYQAFREIRWESVTDAIVVVESQTGHRTVNDRDKAQKVLKMMCLRDGFSLNTGYSFAISSWQNALLGTMSLKDIAAACLAACDEWDIKRIKSLKSPDLEWMKNSNYDPKYADSLREARKEKIKGDK